MAYQLRTHRLGDTPLDVLLRNLLFAATAIILLQWVFRGRPPLPAWHWLTLGLIVAAALGFVLLRSLAGRAGYVRFAAQPALPAPAARAMPPASKTSLFVSGRFSVEEKYAVLADLLAYWRSFETREHAIMAIQHASRFLLGSRPDDQLGMWYIFFRPEDVIEVMPGTVTFGTTARSGLRVIYRNQPSDDSKKPVREVAYLAFENEAGRESVWADLRADQGIS
jgi:hypothetical protein